MIQFASLLYLGMPLFLFFISWLKWYYALVMVTCLIVPLLSFNYNINLKGVKKFGLYFLVFCGFLLLLGYGEVFPQSGDWGKHNAIFSQLYHSWNQPILINYKETNHILCYGLGFYMIPSWIAGLFKSYSIIRWLVLINSAIGLSLIGFWLNRIWKLPLWAIVLVYLVGSLNWVGQLEWCLNHYQNGWDIFYNIGNIQFLTVVDQTPQHQIAMQLVLMVFLNQILFKKNQNIYLFFIVVVGFFWSPFIVFALFPLIFFIKINREEILNFRISLTCFFSILLVGLFLFYYYSLHLKVDSVSSKGLSFKQMVYEFITVYSLLYGIPLFFIFLVNYKRSFIKPIEIKLIFSFLIVTIIYKQINYGYYHDFEGKTTFLIFFIFNVFILRLLIQYFLSFKLVPKISIAILIFILTFMPLKIVGFKIYVLNSKELRKKFYNNPDLLSQSENIAIKAVLKNVSEEKNYPFIIQYLGKPNVISNELIKKSK